MTSIIQTGPGGTVIPLRLLLFTAALALLLGLAAPAAHARTACVDDILDEWVHPSKSIGTKHPLKCYDLALEEAPDDVLLYTNFETDVRSAKRLAVRERQQPTTPVKQPTSSPPTSPPSSNPSPPASPPGAPAPPPDGGESDLPDDGIVIEPEQSIDEPVDTTTSTDPLFVPEPPPVEDVVPIGTPLEPDPVESEAVDAPVIDALRSIGPNNAGSVPVPLIVLTIVCGLLAIIGATLLAARHVQTKRLAEGPPLPPRRPASRGDDETIS